MFLRTSVVIVLAIAFPSIHGFSQDKLDSAGSTASGAESNTSNDSDYRSLVDEPSRAYLFRFIRSAAEKENPATQLEQRSLAVMGPFRFPDDVTLDRVENKPRANSIFGIDISHYEGPDFKFDTLRQQGVRFVYVKATQGVGLKDNMFSKYWASLDALPPDKSVLRGAYHFLSAGVDGSAQADSFIKWVEKNGNFKDTDMPPVLDLEWDVPPGGGIDRDRWKGHSADEIMNTALAWLRKVEQRTHKAPIVYTSKAFWSDRHIAESNVNKIAPHYKIWIANYSTSARAVEIPSQINNVKETIWQFSETAKISVGYDKAVDANIFKGTEAEFIANLQPAPLN